MPCIGTLQQQPATYLEKHGVLTCCLIRAWPVPGRDVICPQQTQEGTHLFRLAVWYTFCASCTMPDLPVQALYMSP